MSTSRRPGRICWRWRGAVSSPLPVIPVDALMTFYMLCLALGEEPFAGADAVVSPATAVAALEALRELVACCAPACLERNPIRTYEAMVARDDLVYCPFAYGYSNYARREYADPPLTFGGLVALDGRRLRSTLGGTGLAISRRCQNLDLALDYAQFVASPDCQRGLYAIAGGQPGHRRAWLDPAVNAGAGDFSATRCRRSTRHICALAMTATSRSRTKPVRWCMPTCAMAVTRVGRWTT